MLSEATRGVYIISATPFTDTGALDLESAERLTDFYQNLPSVWVHLTWLKQTHTNALVAIGPLRCDLTTT